MSTEKSAFNVPLVWRDPHLLPPVSEPPPRCIDKALGSLLQPQPGVYLRICACVRVLMSSYQQYGLLFARWEPGVGLIRKLGVRHRSLIT